MDSKQRVPSEGDQNAPGFPNGDSHTSVSTPPGSLRPHYLQTALNAEPLNGVGPLTDFLKPHQGVQLCL